MNIQYIFIDKSKVPTREQLQKSIDNLEFNLQLDPSFTPFEDSGYSPCTLNGKSNIGFEIFYDTTDDIVDDDAEFAEIANGRNFCISLGWGASMLDCAAVLIVSAAFAKDYEAIISYGGENAEPLELLIEGAHSCIEDAQKD